MSPNKLESACRFYNYISAEHHAPLRINEFRDLVADVVYDLFSLFVVFVSCIFVVVIIPKEMFR